jgi:hypothetical protein
MYDFQMVKRKERNKKKKKKKYDEKETKTFWLFTI